MITVTTIDNGTVLQIDTYDNLQDALDQMIECGWEDDATRLLSSPLLFSDATDGAVIATITYRPEFGSEHPQLVLHLVAANQLRVYRRVDTADAYVAERIA